MSIYSCDKSYGVSVHVKEAIGCLFMSYRGYRVSIYSCHRSYRVSIHVTQNLLGVYMFLSLRGYRVSVRVTEAIGCLFMSQRL